MLIKIINCRTCDAIFELRKEDNTLKDTVEEAVRQGISLRNASLFNANLRGADLRNANLRDAYLRGADLRGADLTGADISGTWLEHAIFDDTTKIYFPMRCPETGSFIGYKKISFTKEYDDYREFIVKLEIPEDAERSSSTSSKCRCSKAKVLEIRDILRDEKLIEITNINKIVCIYKVGEYVYPDYFDECRWHECSNGIHFFMTEEEAVNY